eukprot:scaffold3089_cov136-Isochrysis_galbana.AAC.10
MPIIRSSQHIQIQPGIEAHAEPPGTPVVPRHCVRSWGGVPPVPGAGCRVPGVVARVHSAPPPGSRSGR